MSRRIVLCVIGIALCAAACSQDLSYDPDDPPDAVDACMLVKQAVCELDLHCNGSSSRCDASSYRTECEQMVANDPCGEAIGSSLLACYEIVRNAACDQTVACETACEK